MSIITRMRKQVAVWWGQSAAPDAFGQPVWGAPVQIKCRWEDSVSEYIAKDGSTQRSTSRVYVDRVMKEGDLLRLGAITTLTNLSVPKKNSGVWEIKSFNQLPNIRNSETLLTAYL
jgi:hypothetical protein